VDTLTEQPTEPQIGQTPVVPEPQEMQGQGQISYDQQERNNLTNAGFSECAHPGCGFMHAPGLSLTQTCPNCQTTPEMADQMGNAQMQMQMGPGGATRSGLTLREQGDIGEKLIQSLGYLPGYGPITWWHSMAGGGQSPLDGGTKDWGIEVRAYNADNAALQFNIGADEKITKNQAAMDAGYKGILGILVSLDFRRSLADIYVREFSMTPDGVIRSGPNKGKPKFGIGFYRPRDNYRLLESVPFDNPYLLPDSDAVPETNNSHDEMPF
jgi:hypothetical protein